MLNTNFVKAGLVAAGMASALAFSPMSNALIASYSQDLEAMDPNDPGALAADGWLVGANVFDSGGGFVYNYFAFPAPNVPGGGPGFSGVATGEGGPAQGANQLNTYNDYGNGNHFDGSGFLISANLFRDVGIIQADDVGKEYFFSWDVKQGNREDPTTTFTFLKAVKTSDSSFQELGLASTETTNSGTDWTSGVSSIEIQAGWVGETLQMGFVNNASGGTPSGVFYDNLNVEVPVPATIWLFGAALMGMAGMRRKS